METGEALANIPYDRFDISEEVQEQPMDKEGMVTSDEVVVEKQGIGLESVDSKGDGAAEQTIGNLEQSRSTSLSSGVAQENLADKRQTYERSCIQRWIDCSNVRCPKTQKKLQHFTLMPNYVLRSLITQWCTDHNIEQPTGVANWKLKKCNGCFQDVSRDVAAIEALVHRLSGRSVEEHRAAVAEIRSLSKRSTDNRILIAEAGAIPILVNLVTADDAVTQEHAVTSILKLSIYENNKGLIMLAGAVPSIVQILRAGSMEARENAAATLFSLSLLDENKIIIGSSGAIPALVDLLQNGSAQGKKDAATALFNLCIYLGNKGWAVRAGIITALLKMLTGSRNCMIDEALASNQEAKVSIVKGGTIPILLDLLRIGLPRNKENATAILLSLCKRDTENLACIIRLGAAITLTELD